MKYREHSLKLEAVLIKRDVLCVPDTLRGLLGAGTVHHVAFATEDEATQIEAQTRLRKVGLDITPVLDREYFHSIYFREPVGILFEIATLPPGFTVDEPLEHLGESLNCLLGKNAIALLSKKF